MIKNNASKRYFQYSFPFIILFMTGVLILLLVLGIIKFNDRVTSYYIPVIWRFEHLMEDASHLKNIAIDNKGSILEKDIVFSQFKSSLESARETISAHKENSLKKQLVALLERADFIVDTVHRGNPSDIGLIESVLNNIRDHTKKHKQELTEAKNKIKIFVISTGVLCLFILMLGTYFSYREFRLAELRKRATEITSIITALVEALDARDPYTHGHSVRVALSAVRLGAKMGLNESERETLTLAAMLHDIGKIGVSDVILQKPGKLTDEEYACMKQHPLISAKILEPFDNMGDFIPAILHHHERWDGAGYPHGLAGDEIPFFAQLIAICDSFDAMTSSRPYRQGLKVEIAIEEIKRCSGVQWSRKISETFLTMVYH